MGNIILVGAGGTGMSGVVGLLHGLGYKNIIAIDSTESQLTNNIKDMGIKMIIGHGKQEIHKNDVVIYSAAVEESIEVQTAKQLAKRYENKMIVCDYFEFLGEISKYFISIGIAGTNGKSSTTALALATAKKVLPSLALGILGAIVPDLDSKSYYLSHKKLPQIKAIFDYLLSHKRSHELQHQALKYVKKYYFIVEACEYRRHFLDLDLDYAIITNLELDHTDYYKDFQDYTSAFEQFTHKVKQKIFIPQDSNIQHLKSKIQNLTIEVPVQRLPFKHIRGHHNDINGSLTLALLEELKNTSTKTSNTQHSTLSTLPTGRQVQHSLLPFKGLWRRMELIEKTKSGAKIFSDYGHMASSITLGYETLKEKFPKQKLICIFQPHQINRIVTGRNDFIQSMKGYDEVIIYDIYAARENLEELTQKVPALKGIKTLKELGNKFAEACKGRYVDNFDSIVQKITESKKGDIIVVYSAGDIDFLLRKQFQKK